MRTLGLRVRRFRLQHRRGASGRSGVRGAAGIDTWLVGCFQRAPHLTHAHVDLVLEWRERLGVRRTVLTHMGIDMDWGWLKSNLPKGVEAAVDGQVLDIPDGPAVATGQFARATH